jgi:hypothetical protein
MTEENKVQNNSAAAQEAAATQQAPDLTVSDLNALKTIIDVATQRGAFKAGEMEAVGKVYNKLSLFLASVAPAKEGQPNG